MSNRFVTADLHLMHIAQSGRRGYATAAEHDEAIITTWNEIVRPRDMVIVLGDVGVAPSRLFLPLIGQLHGTLDLISGNHDEVHPMHRGAAAKMAAWIGPGRFRSIGSQGMLRAGTHRVMLSHFPYKGDHTAKDRCAEWRPRDEGLPLFHGHTHFKDRGGGQVVHAGWDAWGAPVPVDTLCALIAA